jgi:spermidine synthase
MFNKKIITHSFVLSTFLMSSLVMGEAATSTNMKLIHQEKSLYRDVQVLANDDLRCMGFLRKKSIKIVGCEYVKEEDKMKDLYAQMLLGGLYINPHPKKVLVVGLGIGNFPNMIAKLYPDTIIDSVDIDPVVVKMAKQYFRFKETDNSRAFVEDGRIYIKRNIKKGVQYDMVVLDAYNSDYIPEHMLTKEFLEEVKQILTPNGVVLANTWSNSGLYANESVTYEAVFGPFYNLKMGNRIIIAQKNGLPPLEEVLSNAVSLGNSLNRFGVTRDGLFPLFSTERDWPADARVLTDQYSPANLLNAQKP